MSSEYMRKLIESIDAAAQNLNEGYEERVDATVEKLKQYYPDGVPKAEFEKAVERAADAVGAIEMRPSQAGLNQKPSTARRDFLKDVKAKLGRFKSDTSKADTKRQRQNEVLERLAYIVDEAIGNAFPDGDPFDAIAPKARKMGIPMDNLIDWLDRAVKKHIGHKGGYHDYVATMWDQHDETLSGMSGYQSRGNPWR